MAHRRDAEGARKGRKKNSLRTLDYHGQRIFDAAPEPKWFYTITDAGHNDTYLVGGDPYFAALRQHIEGAELSRR